MHLSAFIRIGLAGIAAMLTVAASLDYSSQVTSDVQVSKCWSYPSAAGGASKIAYDRGTVFIGRNDGILEAVSAGKRLWSADLGGTFTSNIQPTSSGILAITSGVSESESLAGQLRLLSKDTGVTIWSIRLPPSDEYNILSAGESSIAIIANAGRVLLMDAKAGTVLWSREVSERFTAQPAADAQSLTVATSGRKILTIQLRDGEITRSEHRQYKVTSLARTPLGELVSGDERGNLRLDLDPSKKPQWAFKTGGSISNIQVSEAGILVSSNDNFVYLLSSRNGAVIWKRRLAGRALNVTTLEKFVVLSAIDENGAAVADLLTGKTVVLVTLAPDESIVAPLVAFGGSLYALTTEGAYGFGINGCVAQDKNGTP